MIKRRFFKQEHGDRDNASDSSSSSSDSELEAEASEETDEDSVADVRKHHQSSSSSSGYKSEDSSGNEVDVDSSGLQTDDEDIGTGNDWQPITKRSSSSKRAETVNTLSDDTVVERDSIPSDDVGCILKSNSVFKCRLCPRIVCLSEETLMAHLKSKRHARSEKLLSEGRLKLMLNSDGEIEGDGSDGETHAERHARIVSATQNSDNSTKKSKGRQRQRNRLKKKKGKDSKLDKVGQSTKVPARKRYKSEK